MDQLKNTFVELTANNIGPIQADLKENGWYEVSVPCQTACPAGTDVPGYLKAIREERFDDAYEINLRDNVFPAVLGRICTRPCETACRHGRDELGESVAICFSKRSSSDFKEHHEPRILEPMFPASGKRVAVIGAGPAGLSAARDLRLFGHEVCVYERNEKPGGMMIQGIPEFRLPREIVQAEIDQVLALGIELKCGVEIGDEITMQTLMAEFDAVVLSAGAHKPWLPNIDGTRLDGVLHGFDFMQSVNADGEVEIGSSVVVVGGGFTAIDCAQSARYLGAENVEIVYRRDEQNMRCSQEEIDRMKEEGIALKTHTQPLGFRGDDEVNKVDLRSNGEKKRLWSKSVDTVLIATGQERTFVDLDPEIGPELDLRIRECSLTAYRVDDRNLFVCGDARAGAQSIIHAIGDARACAREIDEMLMGASRFSDRLEFETISSTDRDRKHNDAPRCNERELDLSDRSMKKELVQGFDEETAKEEAWRCYMCNQKVEIDNERCISCGLCLMVMPVENCIVQIKTTENEKGETIFSAIDDFKTYDGLAVDQDKCIRCNACRESCPVDCISLQTATPVTKPLKSCCSEPASEAAAIA